MNKYLILEDGTTYPGTAFGDLGAQVAGELVFNTAMTGYQASLTGQTLDAWLVDHHVPGIEGVDTRAIAMHLREDGTIKTLLVNQLVTPTEFTNLYSRLVGQQKLPARNAGATDPTANLTVALIDLGVKQGIIDNLSLIHI